MTGQINDEPISGSVLRDADVLAIAVHGTSFASDEIAAIEQFVREGGGVVFIGNGGTSLVSASATLPFGLQFLPYSSLAAAKHL